MKKQFAGFMLAAAIAGGGVFAFSSAPASAAPPAEVTEAVTTISDTVDALRGIAIACLSVALIPVGSMLALRFLNMVAGRI